LLPKNNRLFVFLIFWLRSYLMKVIPNNVRAKFDIYVFISKSSLSFNWHELCATHCRSTNKKYILESSGRQTEFKLIHDTVMYLNHSLNNTTFKLVLSLKDSYLSQHILSISFHEWLVFNVLFHFQNSIILTHKTSLTPPLFIAVSVTNQEIGRSCICVLGMSIVPLFIYFIGLWNCSDSVVFSDYFNFILKVYKLRNL
jgi:hypothetical protein